MSETSTIEQWMFLESVHNSLMMPVDAEIGETFRNQKLKLSNNTRFLILKRVNYAWISSSNLDSNWKLELDTIKEPMPCVWFEERGQFWTTYTKVILISSVSN